MIEQQERAPADYTREVIRQSLRLGAPGLAEPAREAIVRSIMLKLEGNGLLGAPDRPPASSGKALTGKAQGAWLPIETAPKDGSEILLTDGSTVCAGFWDDAAGCRRADAGWFEECDRAALINAKNLAATHWQSMPAPPAPSGQGGR